MRVLYFAWLREKIGQGEDVFATLPADVTTPRQLMGWLRGQSAGYTAAFANEALIRCAIDQDFCALDTEFGNAAEIAFFPPVTGG